MLHVHIWPQKYLQQDWKLSESVFSNAAESTKFGHIITVLNDCQTIIIQNCISEALSEMTQQGLSTALVLFSTAQLSIAHHYNSLRTYSY